ncbi:MAG: 3-phosphoserine/phosphohydroxythreonine transaminase [Clostridia bacterium]|nr:3-phosphoserine/phosphohydroxythreonine transaminase [Clostridia bacterium]
MRNYNFSAGPSMLPVPVLEKAAAQMLDYEGTGMSVMEMSHRAKCYDAIIKKAEADLRTLMNIPEGYKVLFVQGGASQQFAAVPLNLTVNGKADYMVTGNFANLSYKEGSRFTKARVVASSEDKTYTYIPKTTLADFDPEADYVHITTNNTIFGTKYNTLPDTGKVPLVADMSSNILSEVMDVSKFDVIYAGAQKNIAPAGLTIVIVKEELLDRAMPICPKMLAWKTQADADSLYNTPPTYQIYIAGLVFEHLLAMGGIAEMEKINKYKAGLLYDFIDSSSFYKNSVVKEDRSIMNVPFVTPSKELDDAFVKQAAANGLLTLKGHRLVGGMRASIYNAMPVEGVQALIEFMKKFELENK